MSVWQLEELVWLKGMPQGTDVVDRHDAVVALRPLFERAAYLDDALPLHQHVGAFHAKKVLVVQATDAWVDTLDALCSPCCRFDQVSRCDAAMWDGFERFVIDRDVRVVAVDQGSELGYTLQVGGVAVATQEQLAASLHDAVSLARPDCVRALDVLHAEDDRDAVTAGCGHEFGQGMDGGDVCHLNLAHGEYSRVTHADE